MKLKGGTNICGVTIVVLCLDSRFPKPPGHIKNPSSLSFPVLYETVRGATVANLVNDPTPDFIKPFLDAAVRLEKDGVRAITGSCGFLALYQKELANAVDVPVFASSIIQVPLAYNMLGRRGVVGVCVPVAAGVLYPGFGVLLSPACSCCDEPIISVCNNKRLAPTKYRFGLRVVNIGIAAERTGLAAKTIRYYKEISLLRPERRANGYRDYSEKDIHKLRVLRRARRLGFSVEHCRQLLSLYEDRRRASSDVKSLAKLHLKTLIINFSSCMLCATHSTPTSKPVVVMTVPTAQSWMI